MIVNRRSGATVAATLLCLAAAASAGPVYRWTDARGVVHFADVPPPQASGVQAESLPDAPAPIAVPPTPAPAQAQRGGTPASPQAPAAPAAGPARVEITDHAEEAVGPAVQAFRGKVKNRGGAEARDVFIGVVVTEATQGDICLREEIDVEPDVLPPGAEGTFDAEFESPCFHGPVSAALQASWR